MTNERREPLSAHEIVELSQRYALFDWATQSEISPIPVARGGSVYFYDPTGSATSTSAHSSLSVSIGHGDRRVAEAIAQQAAELEYVNSAAMTTEVRARLDEKLAQLFPGDIEKSFFTLGSAEVNENAICIAKAVTGRHKILARYRSYHGATAGSITLTGDPRRWANEPGIPGVLHVLDFCHGTTRPADPAHVVLSALEETIELEGPSTIAAFVLEPVTGSNGILTPPDSYLEGVRALCDRYGILLIADEVMTGFGRTGSWFAVEHLDVVPDLITCAKGLTSSYVPLGTVGMRPAVASYFEDHVFAGGLTCNSHPVAMAAALTTIPVYEEDGLIEHARRMGVVLGRHHQELKAKHPSVGGHRHFGSSAASSSCATGRPASRWRPSTRRARRWSSSSAIYSTTAPTPSSTGTR
jgi:taurine---2-oxoglutarate transaminase